MTTDTLSEVQDSPSGADSPSDEHSRNGQDTGEAVKAAVSKVEDRPDRDPESGRFVAGNTANGKALARSDALWSALDGAKRDLVQRLESDLAIESGEAAATVEGLADAYAEATLLRRSLFVRLSELGGPVTAKGRTRALFSTYLQTLDRERRLALDLGLDRKSKRIPTLEEVMDG